MEGEMGLISMPYDNVGATSLSALKADLPQLAARTSSRVIAAPC
jgi:hypothetical protein